MAPVVLKEFILPCSVDSFTEFFWIGENGWYERFLKEKLEDINVSIGSWQSSDDSGGLKRTVHSAHPSKLSFPGLPSHTESIKTQSYSIQTNGNYVVAVIRESNDFKGIPYSDYFSVNTDWTVVSHREGECNIKIELNVVFHKSTWLQGTIEANTKAELLDVYELWQGSAEEYLTSQSARAADKTNAEEVLQVVTHVTDIESGVHSSGGIGDSGVENDMGDGVAHRRDRRRGLHRSSLDVSNATIGDDTLSTQSLHSHTSGSSGRSLNRLHRTQSGDLSETDMKPLSSRGSTYGSEDDLMFFDCEEDTGLVGNLNRRYEREREKLFSVISGGDSTGHLTHAGFSAINDRRLTTPEKIRFLYSGHGSGSINLPVQFVPGAGSREAGFRSGHAEFREVPGLSEHSGNGARDLAVTVVETLFVLAQFSFWKVHRFYNHDMKLLFEVEPSQVWVRVLNSFLPGWHQPVLLKPDLYGPTVAVLIMPQILLLSMGVTRHGCNQSALVGNAVIVAMCLWGGLSAFYRILAFVIAPTINLRHCLCVTGYSFFAWNVSLLLLYVMEHYQDYTGVPGILPLVLIGLPSSIAQGSMFWEHTPASSLEVQPGRFPSSLQQCANQLVRCLQRIAWAIPKIVAFLVVTGTHYQFLWYVARVFLPGKKELCQLSSLVQPSQYADIITQKELRKYAMLLLSGKKVINV